MSEKFVNMDENAFVSLAKDIINKAKENGIVLRILGALSVYIHTEDDDIRKLFYTLERLGEGKPLFTRFGHSCLLRNNNNGKKIL